MNLSTQITKSFMIITHNKLWLRVKEIRHRHLLPHHQVIHLNTRDFYFAIIIGILIISPSWKYFENGNYHWTVYLLSFAASRFLLPILLIWILKREGLTWTQILFNHFGIILFAFLCWLYFPSVLSDMKWIDRYDWFMVNSKIIVAVICLLFIIQKLMSKN